MMVIMMQIMPTLAKMMIMMMTRKMKMMTSEHCLCRELIHGRGGRIPNSNLQFSVRPMHCNVGDDMNIMQSKNDDEVMRIIYNHDNNDPVSTDGELPSNS